MGRVKAAVKTPKTKAARAANVKRKGAQKQTARRTQLPPPPLTQSTDKETGNAGPPGRRLVARRKGTRSSDDSDTTRVASDLEDSRAVDESASAAGAGVDPLVSGEGASRDLVASALWNRYQEHGRLADLEEAIRLDRQSLAAQEAGAQRGDDDDEGLLPASRARDSDPLTMVNLGVSLFDLFNHTRSADALNESVQLFERALALMSAGAPKVKPQPQPEVEVEPEPEAEAEANDTEHTSLPRAKVNLGNAYRARAELHGATADLDRAIALHESVLLETPAAHATWDLETRQNCLARSLMARGSQRDVERAMDLLSFRRAFRGSGGHEKDTDAKDSALLSDHENAISVRFKERYLGVYDADVGIPVPDLTGLITRLTEFPSGCGGYADIFMGEWHRSRRFRQKVAIKVLRRHTPGNLPDASSQINDRVQKMIKAEVRIWHNLEHQNVVKLLGTCRGFGPFPSMICPWYANGSLPNFLRKHKSLIYPERLRLVREVASGLYFLHSNAIIHGDLTGSNILIDENHTACLADFGLSVLARDFDLPAMSSFSSGIGGSVRWTAPELYAFDSAGSGSVAPCVTMYSDVYSFGCVALEIFSGEIPYHHVQHEMEVLLKYVIPGIKPERPRSSKAVKDRHWAAVEHCWSIDPQARPMSKVLGDLFQDSA